MKGESEVSATRRSDAFALGARTVPFFAAIVACAVPARVEAQPTGSQIVNTNGSSTSGWTFSNTSGDGNLNGNFTQSSVGTLSGTWWGLYANTGATASQTYNFFGALQTRGQTALVAGDTVQIDISLGFNNGGTVGISLQNQAGTNRFETYYIGNHASDSFKLNDAGGQENITGPNTSFSASTWNQGTSQFQTIVYTQLAGNAYNLTFDGTPVTNGNLTIAASDITQIRFFNFNAGSGGGNNQYANNLVVVPEPSTYMMAACGAVLCGLHGLRRRRSRTQV